MSKASENIHDKDTVTTLREEVQQYDLKKSLKDNIELFKNEIFNNDDTIVYRELQNKKAPLKFCLIFIDAMTNNKVINDSVIDKIINKDFTYKSQNIVDYIKAEVITVDSITKTDEMEVILNGLLYGESLLLIDGVDKALLIDTKGWETRAISEPQAETVVRGPREGFNESIGTNISLIRRRIISSNLKFEMKEIGARTKTKICIVYMDNIANPKIIEELKLRLDDIDIEGFFSSEVIKELIKDAHLSTFKTVGTTERPDVIASKLLQGRVGVLCDGAPVALSVPFLFIENFQVNEDYYNNFIYASLNRLLRILAFIITVGTPGIYVAFTTFHKEMIPTKLVLSIYSAKEGVPLPTAVEAMSMLIVFEIIREAGIRLPKHVGAAVSIAGTLVLGDAAVNAKFVSAPIVIVTAITGISELVLHDMESALLVSRIVFLLLASMLGLYGIIFGVMGLTIHLMSIKSFGIPYMLKLVYLNKYDIRDTAIRLPWWNLKYRTMFVAKDNIRLKKRKKQ
ncbi:spore germination protein [Clostridium botulinum]|uniref:spore germination protein n=1 Tax=Clostridium botulinum TaxID=1491 RepID=UPI0006A4E784|nr:spore germination protein [Clostridium botulinum]KOC36024.1 spore gernimation protein KA [Clostridium botulinum]